MSARLRFLSTLLIALPGITLPGLARGQTPPDGAAGAYVEIVASAFGVPERELMILTDSELTVEELPVLLHMSGASGISPSALLAQRGGGASWMAIAGRYGLGAGTFHVAIPADEVGPPLERAHRLFAETPPGQRQALQLTDEEIVALENVRLLIDALSVSAGEVLDARASGASFLEAFDRLSGPR